MPAGYVSYLHVGIVGYNLTHFTNCVCYPKINTLACMVLWKLEDQRFAVRHCSAATWECRERIDDYNCFLHKSPLRGTQLDAECEQQASIDCWQHKHFCRRQVLSTTYRIPTTVACLWQSATVRNWLLCKTPIYNIRFVAVLLNNRRIYVMCMGLHDYTCCYYYRVM